MRIEILFFHGCPNHASAVELVRDVVAELGVHADVVEVELVDPADAGRLRFLGSPTIQVNGADVEPAARDRTDFGFSCRTYDGKGLPPRDLVAAAVREAQAGPEPEGHCCDPVLSSDAVPTAAPGQRASRWAVGGSVVSAIAASACCWVPLLLILFGVSAGGLSASFEKYRPLLLGVTAVLLGIGFYVVYFRKPACAPGAECAVPNPKITRFNQVMIWVATVVVIASATFPNYIGPLLRAGAPVSATVPSDDLATLTMRVDGMTCDGCAVLIENALRDVPGVRAASASYADGQAVVSFDSSSPPEGSALYEAVERAGYKVTQESDDP